MFEGFCPCHTNSYPRCLFLITRNTLCRRTRKNHHFFVKELSVPGRIVRTGSSCLKSLMALKLLRTRCFLVVLLDGSIPTGKRSRLRRMPKLLPPLLLLNQLCPLQCVTYFCYLFLANSYILSVASQDQEDA